MAKHTTTETPLVILLQTEGKRPAKLSKEQQVKLAKYVERLTKTKVVSCSLADDMAISYTS